MPASRRFAARMRRISRKRNIALVSPERVRRFVRPRRTFLTASMVRRAQMMRLARMGRYGLAAYSAYQIGRGIRQWGKKAIASRTSSDKNHDYVFGGPNTQVSVTRKTLLANEIEFAQVPSTVEAVLRKTTRNGQGIYVSGIKLCYILENIDARPMRVHMAVIQPRERKSSGAALVDITGDFFKSNNNTNKYANFINQSTVDAWDFDQNCMNINNDRWNILLHKRLTLAGGKNNANQTTGKEQNIYHREEWVPVKKTFHYEEPEAVHPNHPLIVCIWYDFISPAAGPIANMRMVMKASCYYKNI